MTTKLQNEDIDMYLFFDTETSALPSDKLDVNHPEQARILSLCCILTDEKFNEVNTFHTLCRVPPETIIHPKAHEANGLTVEQCNKYGIPVEVALVMFDAFFVKSAYQAAFNIEFDLKLIHLEEFRIFGGKRMTLRFPLCVMKMMTPICKLPSTYPNGKYKWPRLSEAYEYCFLNKPEKTHNAFDDVRSTISVCKWMVDKEHFKPASSVIS